MRSLLLYLPFLLSLLNGLLIVRILLRNEVSPLLRLALGGGLGLGISGYVAYLNFMILSGYHAFLQLFCHAVILALAIGGNLMFVGRTFLPAQPREIVMRDSLYALCLAVLFVPLCYMASFYPYGGWDAWAVWHFKAKFLFLAGDDWRLLFDPVLWRSSPHYPLLVPFINTWGWALASEAVPQIPQLTSLVFTFLTMALLVGALGDRVDARVALIPAIVLLTLPLFAKTAISQYADGVLGFYLLAALLCAYQSDRENKRRYAFLSGLFTGFLSFCKPEGLVAALILIFLFILFIGRPFDKTKRLLLISYLAGAGMTLIPSLLFYAFIAPESTTSINGFLSKANPSTWLRLQTIFVFYLVELVSPKWNGLWIVILLAAAFGAKRIWRREHAVVFFFLILYALAVILYYWMNTHFEILWWMSVSLNRILCSVLPVVLWWVLGGLFKKES